MDSQPTLLERIGGEEALGSLVVDFYDRILADPELSPFFADSPRERIEHMQREFLTVALGGELEYSGRSLSQAHHGRGIKPVHFQRFVDHLEKALAGYGVGRGDMGEIISRINTYVDEVVGSSGGVDG